MATKTRCRTMNCGKKKNLHKRDKRPKKDEKNKKKRPISQKSGVGRATKIQHSCIILIFNQ